MLGSRLSVGTMVVAVVVAATIFVGFIGAPQQDAVAHHLAPEEPPRETTNVSSTRGAPVVDDVADRAGNGNASELCLLNYFEVHDGIDYNQGAMYDAGAVQRGKGGDSCTPRDGRCLPRDISMIPSSAADSNGEDLEPMLCFVRRCMEACVAVPHNECTGFVIRQTTCYLKRFLPMFVVRESNIVTFLRRPEKAGTSFLSQNYAVDDSLRTRIVFGVLAAAQLASERLVPALNTWLCDVDKVVFLEDNAAARELEASMRSAVEPSHLYVRPECWRGIAFEYHEEPVDTAVRSFNGAWKNLPLLRRLARSYAGRLWFSIVDDDSFVLQHNLNVLLTSVVSRLFDPRTAAISLGVVYTDGTTHFTQGGAGIFLSSAAAFNMLENYHACFDKCRQWAGDIRMGCCYPVSAVKMVSLPVFSSQNILHVMRESPSSMVFPVTFHQLKTRSFIVSAYNAEQSELGGSFLQLPPSASPAAAIKPSDRVHCASVQYHIPNTTSSNVCSLNPFNNSGARRLCSGIAVPIWWYQYAQAMATYGCAPV